MKNYSDLSAGQRKWVDLVEIYFPEIGDTITYKQLLTAHAFFKEMREQNAKYRVAKPIWLIGANAIARGVYRFPGSSVKIQSQFSEMETIYHAELKEFGIDPKI